MKALPERGVPCFSAVALVFLLLMPEEGEIKALLEPLRAEIAKAEGRETAQCAVKPGEIAEESESAVQHPVEKRGKKIGRLPLLLVQPDTHHAESAVGQKVIDIRKLRFTVAAGEHFARAFL